MGIGTKASVGHQDITGAHVRIVPATSERSWVRRKQPRCQTSQSRHETAPTGEQQGSHIRGVCAGLATMLLQGGSIGHGKSRTINPKGPMAQPASLIEGVVVQRVARRAEQLLEDSERELMRA